MSGKSLTQAMFTNAATDGLDDARSLRRKAAAQRKLRKAVGAWFDSLEARQLLSVAAYYEDTPVTFLPPEVGNGVTVTGVTTDDALTQGTVSVNYLDSKITFSPKKDYNTPEGVTNRFTYDLSNGTHVVWEYKVQALNDAPTFDVESNVGATEDGKAENYVIPNIVRNLGVGPADEVAAGQYIVSVTATAAPGSEKYFDVQPTIEPVYQLKDGAKVSDGHGGFIIDSYNLVFHPKANASGKAEVLVRVQDNGATLSDNQAKSVFVNIAPVNDPVAKDQAIPAQNQDQTTTGAKWTFVIPDNAFKDADVDWNGDGTVDAADGDTMTLTANKPSWMSFSKNAETGKYELSAILDNSRVGSYDITIIATDGGGNVATNTFTLTVTNVNDAPVQSYDLGSFSLRQGQTVGDEGTTFDIPANLFYDIDANDQVSYKVTLANVGDWDNPQLPDFLTFVDGKLMLTRKLLQSDVKTISLKVLAKDKGNAVVASHAFSVIVANVNDAPVGPADVVIIPPATQGNEYTYNIPSTTFTDADGDSLAFSVAAVDADGKEVTWPTWLSFANGRLSGVPGAKDPGTYYIKVTANDGHGGTGVATLKLVVGDINDPPYSFAIDPIVIEEGKTLDITLDNKFGDPDAGDSLRFTAEVVDQNGNPIPGQPSKPTWMTTWPVDATSAHFVGQPLKQNVGSFFVRLTARDGSGATTSRLFTITVTKVNAAPQVSPTNPIPANLPAGLQDAPVNYELPSQTFTDADGDALSYSVVTVDKDGKDAAKPAWLNIDATTGRLTGTPAAGDVGSYKLRIKVSDGTATNYQDTILTIVNVNDKPTAMPLPADKQVQSIAQNDQYRFAVSEYVVDKDVQVNAQLQASGQQVDALTWTLKSLSQDGKNTPGDAPVWLMMDAATGVISGRPGNGDVGTYKLRATATDNAGEKVEVDFYLTIGNVNDAPTIVRGFSPDAVAVGVQFSQVVDPLAFIEPDAVYGDSFQLSMTMADGSALPSWLAFAALPNGSGVLSGMPTTVGNYQMNLIATDTHGAYTVLPFTLRVGTVNQTPELRKALPDYSIAEGNSVDYRIPDGTFVDPDAGDKLSYSMSITDPDGKWSWLTIDPTTGAISGTPTKPNSAELDPDFSGKIEVTVTAKDNGAPNKSVSGKFWLTINNVNDMPVAHVPENYAVGVNEEQASVFDLSAYAFTDVDVRYGDQLTVWVEWLNGTKKVDNQDVPNWVAAPAWVQLNPGTMSLTVNPPADYAGVLTLRLAGMDRTAVPVYSRTFTLTVSNVNDAPKAAPNNAGGAFTVAEDSSQATPVPGGYLVDPDLGTANPNEVVTYHIYRFMQIPDPANAGKMIEVIDSANPDPFSWISVTRQITSNSKNADGTSAFVPVLAFNPTGEDTHGGVTSPSATTKFRVVASDASGQQTYADYTVTVTATNDAPTISGTLPVVQEGLTTLQNIGGIVIADADAGSATVSVQLSITQGQWLEIPSSVTGVTIVNNKSKSLYLAGSVENINKALSKLQYMADPLFHGIEKIGVVVTDCGNTGDGGWKSTAGTVDLTVQLVNQKPIANNDLNYATVAEDTVTAENPLYIDVLRNDNAGAANESTQQLIITGIGTSAETHGTVSLVMRDGKQVIKYVPAPNYWGPVSFTYQVNDFDTAAGFESKQSDPATVTLTITKVNDAPTYGIKDGTTQVTLDDGTVQTAVVSPEGNITADEDFSASIQWAKNPSAGPYEDSYQDHYFVVTPIGNAASLFAELPRIEKDGTMKFKLALDKSGTAQFSVQLYDAEGVAASQDPKTITFTVNSVNDGPRYQPNVRWTNSPEDTPRDFDLSELIPGAYDPEGNSPVTVIPESVTSEFGTIAQLPDGKYRFTPKANYYGEATIKFRAQDSANPAATSVGSVAFTIDRLWDDAPLPQGATLDIDESSSYTSIDVLTGDSKANPDGPDEVLTVKSVGTVTAPRHGVASVLTLSDGRTVVMYKPDLYYNSDVAGDDTFDYVVEDAHGMTAHGTITVRIKAVNTAPRAQDDSLTIQEEQNIAIDVMGNDFNPDSYEATETLRIVNERPDDPTQAIYPMRAAHGLVTLEDGKLVYHPDKDFSGSDSFSYRISDRPAGDTKAMFATATVYITVTPVADDDTPVVNQNSSNNVIDVLANDGNPAMGWNPVMKSVTINGTKYTLDQLLDKDGNAIEYTLSHGGKVKYNKDGRSFTYTPAADFFSGPTNLSDTFQYEVDSGKGVVTTQTVAPIVNQLPTAVDDAFPVVAGKNELNVLANDQDDDKPGLKVVSVTNGSKGTVELAGGKVYYTPGTSFDGKDTFTYTLEDSHGAKKTATVTVTNWHANDDRRTVNEDSGANTLNVLDNDYTPPTQEWTIIAVSAAKSGKATVVKSADGKSVIYTPVHDYYNDEASLDEFTYTVLGSDGVTTATVTVKVLVNHVNESPVAVDDFAGFDSKAPILEDSGANVIDVLRNDYDIDNGTLRITGKTDGKYGTVTITGNGLLTYTPNLNWNSGDLRNPVVDTFTYRVEDGQGGTGTATVTVVVTPVNDDPQASDDLNQTVNEDTTTNLFVLNNDANPDRGEIYTIESVTPAAHGKVTISGTKDYLIYQPDANYNGPDVFTYTIKDNSGSTKTVSATVSVVVKPVNDAPEAKNVTYSTPEDKAIEIMASELAAKSFDIDGDALTVDSLQLGPTANGGLVAYDNKTGKITYTPAANFNGTDTFTFKVKDASATSENAATVTITVTPVNDAP
ncbi:MAG: tandem-95 repeat protein, partial [Bacillota bacterium]